MFSLELELEPADAARLPRVRAIAGRRAGRARSQPMRLVWHDTPGASLAADGLALCEQGGAMRLERARPNGKPWAPGAPAPVLADPADLDALPGPLLPWVAFDGRASTLSLSSEAAPLALSVFHGTIRSVATERPACRLRIDGDEADVLGLASALATDLRARVPAAALASEAMAQARGEAVPPRHAGAPALAPSMSVADAAAAATAHLIGIVLHECGRATPDAPEPVHQARVALRRLRSTLGLFHRSAGGSAFDDVAAGLKALGRVLGPARDWDVFTRGLGRAVGEAFPADAAVARLLRGAEQQRLASYQALTRHMASAEYRRLGVHAAAIASGSAWRDGLEPDARAALDEALPAFARTALERREMRARAAAEGIEALPVEALHDLRLRGKRLRYAAEMFAPLFHARQARRYLRRLGAVQERLGELNDGAVADALLAQLPAQAAQAGALGIVRGFAAARATRQRPRAIRAWEKFARSDPFWA